jgi:hypothetical protein
MEFSIVNAVGQAAVRGDGPIILGDVDRLRDALAKAPRDNIGLKVLLLNSPGGLVEEAFKMAAVMDSIGVGTIVPPGASCASACAAILFIAGRVHFVAPGGKIGLHTCYGGVSKRPDDVCNDRIAQFAVAHGVEYGSVFIFMEAAPPDGMIWFSHAEANCFGLIEWPEGHRPANWNACVRDAIRASACRAGQRSAC